jgi:hypothetical protein
MSFHPSLAGTIKGSSDGREFIFFQVRGHERHDYTCLFVCQTHFLPASAAERIVKWIPVGFFSVRCFFARLLLSDLDECEVTLVLETEKDSDSVLRFERVSNGNGIVKDIVGPFAVGPPTRVLVPCPAALQQSSCKELDRRSSLCVHWYRYGWSSGRIIEGRNWASRHHCGAYYVY